MKKSRFLLLLSIMSFLAGCNCNDYICDCFSQCENAVNLTFSTDNANGGYVKSETDTIIVYKLAKGQLNFLDSTTLVLDTVQNSYRSANGRYPTCGYSTDISFHETFPFADENFAGFDYVIKVPRIKTYSLTNIEIKGHSSGGCCSCYENDRKLVRVNGTPYDLIQKASGAKTVILRK